MNDKKKIGALIGGVVVLSGLILALLKLNSKPDELVNEGGSGQSVLPSGSIVGTELIKDSDKESAEKSAQEPSYNSERLTEHELGESSRDQSRLELTARGGSESKAAESENQGQAGKNESEKTPESSIEESELATETPKLDTKLAAGLDNIDPYIGQTLGNRKVYFYQHPTQSVGFDLRRSDKMADSLYVHPTKGGFLIFPRHMMSLLDLNEEGLDEWLKKNKIPGAISVEKVDADKRKKLEADKNSQVQFIDAEENYSYAITLTKVAGKEYQNIYNLLDKPLTTNYVASNLSTGGMIGNPPPKAKEKTWDEQVKDWEELKTKLKDNPAIVELNYNFPLLASSEGYLVDDKDIRKKVPKEEPQYTFGRIDLNGDNTDEFIVHAKSGPTDRGDAEGYWVIMTPTPYGLRISNMFSKANGDLLQKDKELIVPSLVDTEEGKILTIDEGETGKQTDNKDKPQIKFKKVTGERGEKLAKDYPDSHLILLGEDIYLMDLKEYDKFVDYALEKIKGADSLRLVGQMKDEKTGELKEDGVFRDTVIDPILYLQSLYPDLPFSDEKLNKLVKTEQFKDIKEPLNAGHFDRVE